MNSFTWNEHFVTGIDEVDSQHMELVNIINRLGELTSSADGDVSVAVVGLIDELADYARFHFAAEEGLMRDENLDPRHLGMQLNEHSSFIDEISRLIPVEMTPPETKKLLDFLVHWLAYHILGSDQSMARQVKLIRSGYKPSAAFDEDARLGHSATEPLLAALNGLFAQVSERNRELHELNCTLEAKVEARTRELAEANRHLEELSLTDVLTGLPNRRHAMRRLSMEWREQGEPLALMMIDADGFKQINDTQGHDAGDLVLQVLSRTIRGAVRTDDLVCRLGGDEFLVICPQTPMEGAMHLARIILARVGALRVAAGQGEWSGSVSIGVAERLPEMTGLDDLMKLADEGVYKAKRSGRKCAASVMTGWEEISHG